MPELTIELPWPVSANRMWRQFRGRTMLSREARAYRKRAVVCVHAAMLEAGVRMLTCPVSLALTLHPPTQRLVDADNRIKGVQDLLEHAGLIQNDSQVYDVRAVRLECRPGGLVVARISWEG